MREEVSRLLVVGAVMAGSVWSESELGPHTPTSACRQFASQEHGGGNRFVDVMFAEGDSVKGRILFYVGPDERTLGYWECSTESGQAEITSYSRTAGDGDEK